MLSYFLLFTFIGFLIGNFLTKDKGIAVIIVGAIIWGIYSAPIWGLASLGEMFLGLYLSKAISQK